MKEIFTLKRKSLESHIKEEFPDYELLDKKNSTLMKWLSKLLFFNKTFMSSYITVVGNKVYVPQLPWNENKPLSACSVLAHEWVHMKDGKKYGIWFKLLYLFPQVLTPLALLGFWNPWFFLFTLCLLPIPAPFRTWFEFRAYVVTIAVRLWLAQAPTSEDWLVKQFTTPAYYWMFPAKQFLLKQFRKETERIKRDDLKDYELEIKKALKVV